jgi:hypothetical protein
MPMTFDGSGTITGLAAGGLPNSSVITADIADAAITAAKLDGAQSGSAPIYGARAWVNFNGTNTVAIRASGNVSSITDNGTGDYTVNFTTALADVNYVGVVTSGDYGSVTRSTGGSTNATRLTSSYRVVTLNASQSTLTDCDTVYVAIFR